MRGILSVFRAAFVRAGFCPNPGSPLLNDERRRAGGGAGWLCAFIGLSLFLLAGCEPIPKVKLSGQDQYPLISGPIATVNFTPVHRALSCMRDKLSSRDEFKTIYVAVGNINDLTGKMGVGETGAVVTRGASLMMISALGKMGEKIKLAERFDPSVANLEFDYIRKRYLGDGGKHLIRDKKGVPRRVDWLPYAGGSVRKSDYYITGGITELNYNIYSGGAEFRIRGGGPKRRVFAMNVGADLRIVRTATLEVIKAISLQKQLVGYEAGVDLFRFFNSTLFEVNAGEKVQEPMQLGVRTIMELGAIELVSAVAEVHPDDCVKLATEWEKTKAEKGEEEGEVPKEPPVITEADPQTSLGRALASKAKEDAPAPAIPTEPDPKPDAAEPAPADKTPAPADLEEKKPEKAAPAPAEDAATPSPAPAPAEPGAAKPAPAEESAPPVPEEERPGEKKPVEAEPSPAEPEEKKPVKTAPAPVEGAAEPPAESTPAEPIPAPDAEKPDPAEETVPSAPEEEKPGEAKPVEAAPAPAGEELRLQVALFNVREQAERLVGKMRELGIGPSRIVSRRIKGRERYLVQVYPMRMADAALFIEQLKQIGVPDAYLVRPPAAPAPAKPGAAQPAPAEEAAPPTPEEEKTGEKKPEEAAPIPAEPRSAPDPATPAPEEEAAPVPTAPTSAEPEEATPALSEQAATPPAEPSPAEPEEKKPVKTAPAPVEGAAEPPAESTPAEPIPAPDAEKPDPAEETVPSAPEEEKPGEAKPVEAAPAPAGEELRLQVALFNVREQAERLVEKMRGLGVGPARIVSRRIKGRERFLVQVHPLEAADAGAFIERLKRIGIRDAYVAPRSAAPSPAKGSARTEAKEKKPVEAAPTAAEEAATTPAEPSPAPDAAKPAPAEETAPPAPAPAGKTNTPPAEPSPPEPEEKRPEEAAMSPAEPFPVPDMVESVPRAGELRLQVALFKVRERAERLVWKMRELGVGPARIVSRLVKGRERYLVQVYPLRMADAEAFIEMLKPIGIADAYVAPRSAAPVPPAPEEEKPEEAKPVEAAPAPAGKTNTPPAEPPQVEAAPAPSTAHSAPRAGNLRLQVALFKFPSNAERLVWKMRELGVGPARIVSRLVKGRERYLVQVYPLRMADAEAFIELLKQIGIADAYVAPRVPAR